MTLRKVAQIDSSGTFLANREAFADGNGAKIYRDVKWDQYVVKFYANGKTSDVGDYFTDDLDDATRTARHEVLKFRSVCERFDINDFGRSSERASRLISSDEQAAAAEEGWRDMLRREAEANIWWDADEMMDTVRKVFEEEV